MRRTRILAIVGVVTVCGAGAAFATHVSEIDPATVPTGTLVAHNAVDGIRVSSIARAVEDGKADVFVTHARFAPGQDTGWHTHPGPVFVQVVEGSLTYEDAQHGDCLGTTYRAGQGFFDRGHGHVHRAVAGASGAEFYPVFVLPPGSAAHIIPAAAPEECTAEGEGDGADKHDDSAEQDDSDHGDDDRH